MILIWLCQRTLKQKRINNLYHSIKENRLRPYYQISIDFNIYKTEISKNVHGALRAPQKTAQNVNRLTPLRQVDLPSKILAIAMPRVLPQLCFGRLRVANLPKIHSRDAGPVRLTEFFVLIRSDSDLVRKSGSGRLLFKTCYGIQFGSF